MINIMRNTLIKRIIVMCLIGIMCIQCFNGYAYANTENKEYTVREISNILDEYLHTNEKNMEKGSPEYVEYLTELLMFEADEEIKKMDCYDEIKVYAANYIVYYDAPIIDTELTKNRSVENENEEKNKRENIPVEISNKTIGQLIREGYEEDKKIEMEILENKKENIQERAAYSPSKAAEYGRKYGESPNTAYNYFSGADCTNFVSQAVKYGGKSMTIPSNISEKGEKYTTTSYWYNKIFEEGSGVSYYKARKYSTAWTTVSGFYTYWANKGATIKTYTSKSSLQNNLKLGDIVQLYNGEKWYHSIIISSGTTGNWKYAGHTTNRSTYPVSNLSDSKYRIIRIS